MNTAQPAVLTKIGFQALIDTLRKRGYRILGPTVRDGAIVYDDIGSLADLPRGWTDEQGTALPAPPPRGRGAVRLCGRAAFGKKFLHPPRQLLWTAERTEQGMHVRSERPSDERFAFIGVRACDLNAILIQDRVLSGGAQVDPNYRARRDGLFVIAVNCGVAGGT